MELYEILDNFIKIAHTLFSFILSLSLFLCIFIPSFLYLTLQFHTIFFFLVVSYLRMFE